MGFDRDEWDNKSIKTSELESDASRFYSIIGEMTGHSGDVERTLTGGASHFTDMVQESIRSEAKYDADLWAKATMWCVVGAGIIREWTGYVKEFRKKLDDLQAEWDEYPPPPSEDSSGTSNDLKCEVEPGVSPEMQNYLSAKQDKLNELNRKAEEALEKLEDQTSKINGDLEKGPDDFVVKKLVESGAIGWAAYSVLGVGQPVPVDFDGERGRQHAAKVADALEEGDDIPPHILAALAYLNMAGFDKRANGGELSGEELKYLEEFYGGFDGDSEKLPGGTLDLPDRLTRNDNLTNEERQEVLSVLGGGLLTLSNEENGGSLDRLPPDVQRVVEGPDVYPTEDRYYRYYDWGAELRQLSALISPTGDQIEGGTAFSAGLTTTIGNELHENSLDPRRPVHEGITSIDPKETYGDGNIKWLPDADGVVQSLLGVSLRNEDANHQILAGEHESLRCGSDPSKTIAGIFGHDWPDQGETAGKLIDWIPDAANSEDPEVREKAAYATLGLVEHSTNPDAFGDLTQDNSVGKTNPNVSMAMGEVFNRYIYDFGRDGGNEFDFLIGDNEARVKDGEEYLQIPIDARLKFMQLAASDDEAAQTMYKDIKMHQIESVDDYFNGHANPEETASNVGRVHGLFDTALYHEGLDSYGTKKEAKENSIGIHKTGTDMFIDLSAGNIPIVGGSASTALKEYAGSLWDGKAPEHDYLEGHLDNYETLGEANVNNTRLDIQLQLIHSIEATEGKIEESEGIRANFLNDNGELARISQDIPTGVREDRVGDANDLLESAGHPELADNYFTEWERTRDEIINDKLATVNKEYLERYNPTHEK
ncbi:TPR repeat region-containing protein [Halostreptopolyspora alba]|uniref:TPR repeat domain-containing protein n=1 Tax=Halostreptopolyspora alba TaxID=2487137 RepID=A0A3N0ECI0_9ACTN|nr:hypothetical protein EFW17_08695 [Nocardiopsaceae bacterium YIM 96095]